MSNRNAIEEFLAARPSVSPLLAELARSLAAELDGCPETGFAATAKQYQALVEKLLADDAGGAGPIADVLAAMGDAS